MARKEKAPSFNQIVELLRGQSFEIAPSSVANGAVQVSKYGIAAVIAPVSKDGGGAGKGEGSAASLVVTPGVLVKGEIARLLDRGYQKFIQSARYELPATAAQLQAIHVFTEELNLASGTMGLYNEGLGTTSDLYHYDRLRGRETPEPAPVQPWQLTGSH